MSKRETQAEMGIVSALASVSSSPPNATRGDQIDYWCHIQTDRQIVRLGEHPHDHTDSMHPKLNKISHFRHSLLSILPYGQSGNSPTIPRTPARAQPGGRQDRKVRERQKVRERERKREMGWGEGKRSMCLENEKVKLSRVNHCWKVRELEEREKNRQKERERSTRELNVIACQHRSS